MLHPSQTIEKVNRGARLNKWFKVVNKKLNSYKMFINIKGVAY